MQTYIAAIFRHAETQLPRETIAFVVLNYIQYEFQNLVEAPDFSNKHTKILKITYN